MSISGVSSLGVPAWVGENFSPVRRSLRALLLLARAVSGPRVAVPLRAPRARFTAVGSAGSLFGWPSICRRIESANKIFVLPPSWRGLGDVVPDLDLAAPCGGIASNTFVSPWVDCFSSSLCLISKAPSLSKVWVLKPKCPCCILVQLKRRMRRFSIIVAQNGAVEIDRNLSNLLKQEDNFPCKGSGEDFQSHDFLVGEKYYFESLKSGFPIDMLATSLTRPSKITKDAVAVQSCAKGS
ncbi:hypothetical protein EJB05_12592, partial [Eragrostis curvula]